MTISEIEDVLLSTISNMGSFACVASFGRDGSAATAVSRTPAAYLFFDEDAEVDQGGRPVDKVAFHVLVRAKNLMSEAHAARDAYTLIDLVRDGIRGKTLGLAGISPFVCTWRRLTDYDESSGTIVYLMRFETYIYQPAAE